MRLAMAATLLLLASTVHADSSTRTYSGGMYTRWATRGPHGHDVVDNCSQPIRRPYFENGILLSGDCNTADFVRGNLDNSLGYRAGIERDYASLGLFRFVGGADTSVAYTEYNLTQKDFLFFSGATSGGIDLEYWGGRVGVRFGAGLYATSDQRYGAQTFHEFLATIPLRQGAAVRISRRIVENSHSFDQRTASFTELFSPVEVHETSVAFVISPGAKTSNWEFATAAGNSIPGALGTSLHLGRTKWNRLTASRSTRWEGVEAQLSWTATAHESDIFTVYRGFPRNQRSKTIESYGLGLRKTQKLSELFTVAYGAGLEVANWHDEHHLLVDARREDVIGGIKTGVNASAAFRIPIRNGLALEAMAEQVYWPGIGLDETRTGLAIVLTR